MCRADILIKRHLFSYFCFQNVKTRFLVMPLLDIAVITTALKLKRHNSVPFVADYGEKKSFSKVLAEAKEENLLSITFFKGCG